MLESGRERCGQRGRDGRAGAHRGSSSHGQFECTSSTTALIQSEKEQLSSNDQNIIY